MNYNLLKSKTFWTFVLMFIVGGVNAVTQVIPPDIDLAIMGVLAWIGSTFHLQTARNAGATN